MIDVAACRAHLQARQAQHRRRQEQRQQAVIRAVHTAISTVVPRFPNVQRAYLFGSILHASALHATSDVDIAVEGPLDAQAYFTLWRELERALDDTPIDLDLVTLDRDLHFANRVREQGALIYERTT
jgi:predicted nucleotidyltransferase